MNEKLFIIIPAYNEMEMIEQVINEWYSVVEKIGSESRLVVIDDGSKDETYRIICRATEEKNQLIPITKPNSGHGATILFGYQYAIDHGADYIFQTDSDGQTIPDEFWPFWDLRHDYELVIGHRNKRKDGVDRIFVTKVLKYVILICFGVKVRDANTPFRLMEVSTLKKYITLVPQEFNLTNVILSVAYTRGGVKIKWLPITFKPRQGGINSINMRKIVIIGKKAVKDFRQLNEALKRKDL